MVMDDEVSDLGRDLSAVPSHDQHLTNRPAPCRSAFCRDSGGIPNGDATKLRWAETGKSLKYVPIEVLP